MSEVPLYFQALGSLVTVDVNKPAVLKALFSVKVYFLLVNLGRGALFQALGSLVTVDVIKPEVLKALKEAAPKHNVNTHPPPSSSSSSLLLSSLELSDKKAYEP